MNQASASAPGKVMLLGEHSVVYGFPCLVMAIAKKISVTVQITQSNKNILPDSNYVKIAVSEFLQNYKIKSAISIKTEAEFPSIYGLGSSSAVTVATLKALSELFKISLSTNELFNFSLKITRKVYHQASGFDLASAIYGGIIFYQLDSKPEQLPQKKIPLLIIYSGLKAKTQNMVEKVAEFKKNNPKQVNFIFSQISDIVLLGKSAYLDSDWLKLGELFNRCHKLLVELSVSTDKLNLLQKIAIENGAYGAKLSGAGGGDCLIALYKENQKVNLEKALIKKGGKILNVL